MFVMDFSLNVNRVQAVVFVGMRERRRKGRRIGSVRCACRRRAGGDERTCTWKGISRAEEGKDFGERGKYLLSALSIGEANV